MESTQIVDALAAIAQTSRLAIFRLLVEAGPEGLAAGAIAEKLELPGATLSFHLSHLARARLVKAAQSGRYVIYTADFGTMNELVGYLTENCCGGRSCAPVARPSPIKRRTA